MDKNEEQGFASIFLKKYVTSWGPYRAPEKDSTGRLAGGEQSALKKVLPFPGLIVCTAISGALLYGIQLRDYYNYDLYSFIQYRRSSVQAILSVLTYILGFAHLYVLTSMFNFTTRILLTQYSPTLERLKWWKATSSQSIDLSLPLRFLVPAALFFGFTLLPATLWTGALTPNLVEHNTTASFIVPFYLNDLDGKAWNATWTPTAEHTVFRTQYGSFSYTPAFDRGGSMINTAAGIIYDKDFKGNAPRSDKTGFTYKTRSYGVGASVGLTLPIYNGSQPMFSYVYEETGYKTKVDCNFNSSSQWKITPVSNETDSPYIPNLYYCGGATPDGAMDWYLQHSTINDSNIVAINAHAEHVNPGGKGIVTIATGTGAYSQANNAQCSVQFIPTLFQVEANLTSQEISVTELGDAMDMDPTTHGTYSAWSCTSLANFTEDPNQNCGIYTAQGQPGLGNIATRALRQLVDLSTLDADLHSSALGEMFLSDVQNEEVYDHGEGDQGYNITNIFQGSPNPAPLPVSGLTYSIEQAIRSILDDSLLAFSSAQLVLEYPGSTKVVDGTLSIGVIEFGTRGYVYCLFAFNLVVILILLEEMIRTRGWKHLPLFDYADIKSVIIATSMGGTAIAKKVVAAHDRQDSIWVADPSDPASGSIQVQLSRNEETDTVELVTVAGDAGIYGEGNGKAGSPMVSERRWKKQVPYAKIEMERNQIIEVPFHISRQWQSTEYESHLK